MCDRENREIPEQEGKKEATGEIKILYYSINTDFSKRILLRGLTFLLARARRVFLCPWSAMLKTRRQEKVRSQTGDHSPHLLLPRLPRL